MLDPGASKQRLQYSILRIAQFLRPWSAAIPSEPTPSPIPTSDSREIEWATYTNSEYGFSFEYPAQYTSNQVPKCAPRGLQHSKGAGIELYVGSGTAIFVWKLQDPTWQDYACRMLKIN